MRYVREYWREKYHCTIDLLFDWCGISCMTTDNFCFYLQNRLIQTVKQEVNGTVILPPLVFPGWTYPQTLAVVMIRSRWATDQGSLFLYHKTVYITTYIYIYKCVCVCEYCEFVTIYIYIYIYKHIHKQTHTHTQPYIFSLQNSMFIFTSFTSYTSFNS